MKRFFALLFTAVMTCSLLMVAAHGTYVASPEHGDGGGGGGKTYYRVTVNYYDKESGEKIAESYVSELIRSGRAYDVTDRDAIEIEGYAYDSTTGDPVTGTMNSNKVVDVWYVVDESVPPVDEPEPPVDQPEPPVDEPEPPVDQPEPPVTDPEPPAVDTGVTTPTSPQTGYEVGVVSIMVIALLCGAVAVVSVKKVAKSNH